MICSPSTPAKAFTRIVERAEEISARQPVLEAFGRLPKLARGPKPVAALRKLGVADNLTKAPQPTTDGLLELIASLDVRGTDDRRPALSGRARRATGRGDRRLRRRL